MEIRLQKLAKKLNKFHSTGYFFQVCICVTVALCWRQWFEFSGIDRYAKFGMSIHSSRPNIYHNRPRVLFFVMISSDIIKICHNNSQILTISTSVCMLSSNPLPHCGQLTSYDGIVLSQLWFCHMQTRRNFTGRGWWGQHGAQLGPTGPKWAPCWLHEPWNLGVFTSMPTANT